MDTELQDFINILVIVIMSGSVGCPSVEIKPKLIFR